MEKIKKTIWAHLEKKEMDDLKKILNTLEDIEILEVLRELHSEERAIVYRLLSKDKALIVFEQLDTSLQQKLLSSFTEEKVIEVITNLEPDDRVRLLEELPAKVTKKLIQYLSAEERDKTALLMGYEEETAGRIMTTEYISIKKDFKIFEALEKIKSNAMDKETIYTIYITDDQRRLEGVVSLREILIADSNEIIENIMHKKVVKVSTGTD